MGKEVSAQGRTSDQVPWPRARPGWWNGRHCGLKSRCSQERVGSTPTPGTRCWRAGGSWPHAPLPSAVDSALAASDAGVPDAESARRHGVTVQTIRRWRRAYQRQGVTRGQTPCLRRAHSAPGCPSRRSPMRSYWAGLGDGYIILARRGVYSLSIFNDAKYAVVNAHIQDLLRAVKPGCRPHTRRRPGCLVTTVGWKHWPCLSPSTGRAASTSGPSRSQPGSRTSSALIRGTSCAASSIPMAPEWPTGPEEWSPAR